jgi:hypothetical protein
MNYQRLESIIQQKHDDLELSMGWRLLYSPLSTIGTANIAFIGLQPGNGKYNESHPKLSSEDGSSYEIEKWDKNNPGEARLQKQVRILFNEVDVNPKNVLAGNLVPFRSPNWSKFTKRQDALEFGINLWMSYLSLKSRKLIITMSRPVTDEIGKVLDMGPLEKRSAGWGDVLVYRGRKDGMTLLGIPHLSRFQIMGRTESRVAIDWMLEGLR